MIGRIAKKFVTLQWTRILRVVDVDVTSGELRQGMLILTLRRGAQAEYLLVPNAQANLAKIPDELSDEQVVLLADIASTGISAAESANLKIGDTVAIFAQGPIGLCATAGARLKGASLIAAVESDPTRAAMAKRDGR